MFSAWIALVAGLYMLTMGLITTVSRGVGSRLVFKVIPVVLGFALLVSALSLFGFVVVL